MELAHLGSPKGPLVDPVTFIKMATPEYKKRGIFPYCDGCQEIVHTYGVHTPNPDTVPRFDHADLLPDADPLDDCILANRNARYRGLGPDGWDDERGRVMRSQFFEEENLRLFYAFCLALCRNGNLPTAKFRSMIRRADKKRVWAYVDIPLWAIPYVLLTLENFVAAARNGKRPYAFHFIFNKPAGTNVSALWKQSSQCEVAKIFSSNGKPVAVDDNPFPVTEEALINKAGDTSWITAAVLQMLRA